MRSVAESNDSVPAFLAKLWKLVDESRTNNVISWAQGGTTFVIKNQIDFARKLLPLYYKHNNMASFIRQLNMYGFHKVVSVDNGSLKCENEEIQFSHPFFVKEHAYLLKHIKRKISSSKANPDEKAIIQPEMMTKVLTDVKSMKGRQESLDARFSIMKHENEALWREVALLRQKHHKQQQIVNNLIQFIMSIVQNSRNGPLKTGVKRRYQLMINDAAHNNEDDENRGGKSPRVDSDIEFDEDDEFVLPESTEDGPIIHEVGDQEHTYEGASSFSLLTGDPTIVNSPAGRSSDISSPAAPVLPEVFEEVDSDLADAALQSLSIDTTEFFNDSPLEMLFPNSDSVDSKSMSKTSKNKSKNSKTKKKSSSPSSFIINSPQESVTLPTEIFNDEGNSQDPMLSEVDQNATLAALQSGDVFIDSPSNVNDEYINNIVYGNYNPNINLNTSPKGKKAKNGKLNVTNIKQELPSMEDDDSNSDMTMVLSRENKRPIYSRFNSVSNDSNHWSCSPTIKMPTKRENYNEDVDDHLLSMQNDIESLKELLRRDTYSFDANTVLGLFGQEEPFYGLSSINPSDMTIGKSKEAIDESNQLISYVPPGPNINFDDLELGEELNSGPLDEIPPSPIEESVLNTPQVQLLEPNFPKNKS